MKKIPQHITVNIPQGAMGAGVGEVMSVRVPIVMTDEAGREIRGFFTKDEYVSTNDLTYSRSGSIPNAQNYGSFLEAIKAYPKDIYAGFFQYLYAHDFRMNETRHLEESEAARKIASTFLTNGTDYAVLRGFLRDELHLSQEDISRWMPPVEPREPVRRECVPFARFFGATMAKAGKLYQLTTVHVQHQRQSANSNINRRNNAMSDYADLLDASGLIARSVDMTVVQDGKPVQGTYMLNAEGITCGNLNVHNPALRPSGKVPSTVILEPEAKRDLSRMQVIDFLCGNVDRHGNNFLFKVDTTDPTTVRIRGVVGIDNDGSFGAVAYKGAPQTRFMSPIQDIKVIDGVQANAILALTPEKLDQKIRLAGLSKEEVNAAHERLAALQKRIRDKDIRIIRSMDQWNALDTKKLETRAKDGSFINLFSIVGRRMRSFFAAERVDGPNNDVFSKVKAEVVNIQDDHSLQGQAERFKELQDIAAKYDLRMVTSPTQAPYLKALADTVSEMERLQKELAARAEGQEMKGQLPEQMEKAMFRQLSDRERNLLSLRLKELQELAEAYAAAEHTRLRTKADKHDQEVLLNNARNVAAYAAEARTQLQTISAEAEMDLAAKLAQKIDAEKKQREGIESKPEYVPPVPAPPAPHSYEGLIRKLNDVDSGWIHSSPAFKEMIEDLKAVGGSEEFPTETARKVGFQKLTDSVNAYLAYKKKEFDSGKKLSPYAQERIKYALQIREFASAKLTASKNSLEDISRAGEFVQKFINQCKDLRNEFKAAKTDEARREWMQHVAAFREDYKKNCQTLVTIAKAHSDDQPTQLACYNNLKAGPISAYQTMYEQVKKKMPDTPPLFDEAESTKIKEDVRQMGERCKAFPQTNAANVVKRAAPKAGKARR